MDGAFADRRFKKAFGGLQIASRAMSLLRHSVLLPTGHTY